MGAQADTEEQALAAAALVVLSRESRQRQERKPQQRPQQSLQQQSPEQDMEPLDPAALDDAMKVVVACMRELKRIVCGVPQAPRPRKRRSGLEWECPACMRGTGTHNHLVGSKRRRQKRGGE